MDVRKIFLIGSFCCSLLAANSVKSQIVPDNTTNTSIINNCQSSCNITGGTVAGQNLFHSFEQFNIGAGGSAYFVDPGVANIFSRVTGNSASQIFGTLGVSGGDANLFLLNPNGIIFGAGAALDLNGSFLATTADVVQFGDRSFSALPDRQENLALLNINPSALFYNQMGQNSSITAQGANLSVSGDLDIALIGKQTGDAPGILLENASINTAQGNINLGAIRNGAQIGIDNDLQLNLPENTVKGDIVLSDTSKLETDRSVYIQGDLVTLTEESMIAANSNNNDFDGGKISFRVNNLVLKENSQIYSFAGSDGKGADVNIQARSATIIGRGNGALQRFLLQTLSPDIELDTNTSIIETVTTGAGDAGNITIKAQDLAITDGARIISNTTSQGKSGDVAINVVDTLTIQGAGLLTGSAIFGTGAVGETRIQTNQLLIEQGGFISSASLGSGEAGSLSIFAEDLVSIRDTPANSIVPTGIFTNSIFGNAKGGDLSINTSRLILQNGGQLSASNGVVSSNGIIPLGGEGGSIKIDAVESVEIVGASADGVFSSSILSDTRSDNRAGNITINTANLSLSDSGFISASSIGTGDGGNIIIDATNSIKMTGYSVDNLRQLLSVSLSGEFEVADIRGGLTTLTVVDGDAGNIDLTTPRLYLENGAVISTATFGDGDAGNLTIAADTSIELIESVMISPTFSSGNGGDLDISTQNLSLSKGSTIASASTGSGNAGDLSIAASESVNIFFRTGR